MRLNAGDNAPRITLQNLYGESYTLADHHRLTLLAFHRFAGCPFCNLRVSQLIKRYPQWQDKLDIIVIFDSSLENLQLHALNLQPPFPVLADKNNEAYQAYGIEFSWLGVLKGVVCRFPTMIQALKQGFTPKSLEGKKNIMPASFIIDELGIILHAYYGQDEGDHLPLEKIQAFLLKHHQSK